MEQATVLEQIQAEADKLGWQIKYTSGDDTLTTTKLLVPGLGKGNQPTGPYCLVVRTSKLFREVGISLTLEHGYADWKGLRLQLETIVNLLHEGIEFVPGTRITLRPEHILSFGPAILITIRNLIQAADSITLVINKAKEAAGQVVDQACEERNQQYYFRW